mgnify:FL=1
MPSIKSILTDIQTLPLNQVEELLSYLEEFLVSNSQVEQIYEDVKEFRFSKGKVCPHCSSELISKNGKYNGKQRYICKDCKRTFTDFTNSAVYRSKKSLDKWLKYAKCMIMGLSIRKSAKIVGINIATSFFWRHKILDCISAFLGTGHVDGLIEADEVFFAENFKGTKTINMPRESHKRGKSIKKRGISKEQICIATALDRQGNLIIEPLCKGRMTYKELENLYKGHIGENSILCTDSHKSYIRFATDFNLDHKRIKTGKHKEDIYHIQHINNLHSNLKRWMRRFNGVASKYISNYMHWFKWLRIFESDKDSIKTKNFIVQSNVVCAYTKVKDFKLRTLKFV